MPKSLLLKRRSGLYVRFLVPGDLQGRIGSRFIVRSLQGARADSARLMAAALGYALSKAFERLRMDAMAEPKGLLDIALAGVKKGKVYDIELPNGAKIRTDGSEAEHQRVREAITDLEKQVRSPLLHRWHPPIQKLDCCPSASKNSSLK